MIASGVLDRLSGPAVFEWRCRRTCDFAINGRFFGQTSTGVQRYALEITRSMDGALSRSDGEAVILVPAGMADAVPPFEAIAVREIGVGRGHAWEQTALPVRSRGRLLNLCNTAPALPIQQVVCIHDANVFEQPESYSWAFRAYYKTLQPWISRRALRVATVSMKAADDLMRCLGVPAKALVVLPNGHEHVLQWNAGRSSIMGRLPGARPYVFILGSRARHKNIDLILNMADEIDALGFDIVVAGEGASIFAKTAAVPRPNIRALGRVSDDDLAALLSNAVCLAFPSLTEGFGIPIVEAMALGCPVISSNRASLPEVCGSAALLADPTDPAAWREQLTRLAASPALREDLRQAGLIQVQRWSWEASARGYLDVMGDPNLASAS